MMQTFIPTLQRYVTGVIHLSIEVLSVLMVSLWRIKYRLCSYQNQTVD